MVDFISLFTGMAERDIGFLLKSMVQDSINSQLTNAEISEIDEKTPVLITNSKDVELMNDISIQSAINIEPSTVYLMPEEPDGVNLKLWLKFQNAGELRDYSYQKNKSYSTGANTMPGLFSKYNNNSMMKYELYSYFNGISHYAYTVDGPTVRILPNITANKITSFFMRLAPVSLAKVLYADNNALFTKVDDDQLRYGYSVTVDANGTLHFYVRNNYVQYYLSVPDAYNYILTDPLYQSGANFRFENFNKNNFLTGFQYLCGLVAEELPFHDWFFKYNPTGHNMSIINTIEGNSAVVAADTSLITEIPYLSCPLQEGKYTHSGTVQTTIYDNSGHANNGIITGYTTGGNWNDDNTLTTLGSNAAGTSDGISIDFGTITSLQTLTEFTVSFWYNPLEELINNKSYNTRLFSKGYAIANSIYIERRTGVNDLKFSFRFTDNIERSVTFSNPFPAINSWYFISCRWKSGETMKITVNDTQVVSGTLVTGTLSTAGNLIKLYNVTRAPIGIMTLFKMDNKQVSQTTQDNWFYEGYHNPLFPKSENIQPVPDPTPDPVFVPFTNSYTLDKQTTPVAGDYRKINSLSGDNPFLQRYSVADGTSTTDPELNPYIIADGVDTGGGSTSFTEVYTCTDPSNNSFVQLDGSSDNDCAAVEIQTGSALIGKKITKAIFFLKGASTPTGTVRCKVFNAAGVLVTTLWYNGTINATLNAATVDTSTSTAYTFQNIDLTPWGANSLAVGWRIGIEYNDGGSTSDQIQVKRNRSNPKANEWGNSRDYSGNWSTSPDNDDIVGNLFEGGTGSPVVEPSVIMKFGSYNRVVEGFGVSDPLMTKLIGKVTFRVKKLGSPTGTATIALVNNASPPVVKAIIGTFNVSTDLTTSYQDITRTNYTHGVPVSSGDRLGIIWTPSASGEVHVLTNRGNVGGGNTWQGNTSYVLRYISAWSTDIAVDLAGKIYTGGNDFDAYLRFSTVRSRITVKAVNSSSSIHNRKISKVVIRAKKVGAPGGIITCYVRDSSDVVKVTYSSVDASTLGTSYGDVEFTNVVHNYLINQATGSADKVSIEYSGADVSNYVELNINKDVIDTVNTIAQTYDSGNYVDNAQIDIAGKMYDGGEPDLNSRTRVVQSIEHQNSRLKAKKLTRIKAYLYRTTVGTSGTAYCNIRRGTDDSLVKTIGTVSVSTLSTTVGTPSAITFTDTTNNYPLNVGDKVSIEFNGGNTTDQVGVLVRSVTPNYDLTNSYIRKYDEVDYDDAETTMDLCAVMDEGGFYFTPEPNSIPDPTPVNIKDLLYCAGNNAKSGFMETFLMQFRIYTKDITLDNADNLYNNRYSISPISPNAILMPFSFRMVSLTEP